MPELAGFFSWVVFVIMGIGIPLVFVATRFLVLLLQPVAEVSILSDLVVAAFFLSWNVLWCVSLSHDPLPVPDPVIVDVYRRYSSCCCVLGVVAGKPERFFVLCGDACRVARFCHFLSCGPSRALVRVALGGASVR